MPDTSTLGSFRVGIDPALLQKARNFFNASLEDVLNELLQNSRRAGASRVTLSVDRAARTLTMTDDGAGIFRDGVAVSLGGSGWDNQVQNSEDPAGCGLFSLAGRVATIESRGFKIRLDERKFNGLEDVPIETGADIRGTRIAFSLAGNEVAIYRGIVEKTTRYYPLPVFLDGEQLDRFPFLHNALYTRSWRGLTIGVFRNSLDRTRINFHGITLETSLPSVNWRRNEYLIARIDVNDCPELRLVLPARKEVVRDAFFDTLLDECYRTLYLYIADRAAAGDSHRLPYRRWLKARELGIELPEAEPVLDAYVPDSPDHVDWFRGEEVAVDENSVLDGIELASQDAQAFWRGFERAGLPYRLLDGDRGYQGYSWYDRLPVLSEVKFEIRPEVRTEGGRTPDARPDEIIVTASVTCPEGTIETFAFPTDVAFIAENTVYDLEDVAILVTRNATIEVSELVELLEWGLFSPSDESDSDSYDTQKENFREGALSRACRVLISEEEAIRERVRSIVDRHLSWFLPEDRETTIRVGASGGISVVFDPPEAGDPVITGGEPGTAIVPDDRAIDTP